MQHNKYVGHQDVKMYCATNQFPELKLLGPNNKPHGVRGLGKHYHMCFDTKIGHDTCETSCIPFACTLYTYIIDQPRVPGFPSWQQPCYQPIQD